MTDASVPAKGPLAGVRIVEFAGIGPAPFAVMLLADMGAEVLRIERAGASWPDVPIVSRGRASLLLNLKDELDRIQAMAAVDLCDIVIEGFRPGVMERLGLGPNAAMARNPRLIYGRITGWGRDGPLAPTAGHDINYLAVAGVLDLLAGDGKLPVAPLNLLGDYAGGALYLVMGICAALYERERSGKGQIVDAAIVDGCASLLAPILGMAAAGLLAPDPANSMLSGRLPYYRTYRCADGGFVAVGALESHFQDVLTDRLGLERGVLAHEPDTAAALLERIFASADRAEWERLFAGSDACVSPVLSPTEAAAHPAVGGRGALSADASVIQPGVAPRLSRTPGGVQPTMDGTWRLESWRSGRPRDVPADGSEGNE